MIKEIKSIAELQPRYSSKNTPEMSLRGNLIRSDLPDALRKYWGIFKECLGPFSKDMDVEGRDGMGAKTQAPWVRIFSKVLSPSATIGYYMVIHFSTDGKYCFITIGCGSSKWDNEKSLVQYSDAEIKSKVDWALHLLSKNKSDTSKLPDKINIGSSHRLPKSFEKATILCKSFEVATINEEQIVNSISDALKLLSVIYEYSSQLSDVPQSDIAISEIETAVNPARKTPNNRQGYGLSGDERKAVELRAMAVTHEYLSKLGYKLEDTSSNNPFDYLATKNDKIIKVEVKGTTSEIVDSIMMTSNEVKLHTNEAGKTALAIVRGINFIERGNNAKCDGGLLEYFFPWLIKEWTLETKAFLVSRP